MLFSGASTAMKDSGSTDIGVCGKACGEGDVYDGLTGGVSCRMGVRVRVK